MGIQEFVRTLAMPMSVPSIVEPPGKLAILFAGMGSLATTTIACTLLARRDALLELSPPLRLTGAAGIAEVIRTYQLAGLDEIVFGAWDVLREDAFAIADFLEVLPPDLLAPLREEMQAIVPMRGVFDPANVPGLYHDFVKPKAPKSVWAAAIEEDIGQFKRQHGCARAVVIWTGTRETYSIPTPAHRNIESFEFFLQADDPAISCSQIYAWASIRAGVPFLSGGASNCIDYAAIRSLAREKAVPLAGENFLVPPAETIPAGAVPPVPAADPKVYTANGPAGTSFTGTIDQSEENPTGPRPRRESRATAPLVLEAALLLDLAHRHQRTVMQHWLNVYFSRPVASRGPEVDTTLFLETLGSLAAPAPLA